MRICAQCVLPETFPGISFDSEGTCNFCRSAEDSLQDDQKRDLEKRFLAAIDRVRGTSPFDCIVAYSGGKDSSYLLDLLVTRYNLRILAVTFDNWFLSEMAFRNITAITRRLNVSHMLIRPPHDLMKGLFREASRRELYSRKSLERASTICTTCISFVRFSCLRTAIEKEIPFVIFAFNPGQVPTGAAFMQSNPGLLRNMQRLVYLRISAIAGDGARPYFLEERHLSATAKLPYIVNPFVFLSYREEAALARIRELGWCETLDTDANSTNCLLNRYAIWVHFQRYKFHPYAGEIASMVRKGLLDRDEGLRRLAPPEDDDRTVMIGKQLNESSS